jgi:hypothetical protein
MLVGVGRICISLAVPLATDTPDEPGIDAELVVQALEYLAAARVFRTPPARPYPAVDARHGVADHIRLHSQPRVPLSCTVNAP